MRKFEKLINFHFQGLRMERANSFKNDKIIEILDFFDFPSSFLKSRCRCIYKLNMMQIYLGKNFEFSWISHSKI